MVGGYRRRHSRRTSEDSDDASSLEEETSSSVMLQYSGGKEYMDTEWTDEKHSIYLKSMEASFVDQLYNSFGALGNKENVSSTSIKPSQEQKINVKEPEHRINGRHGASHEFLRSPWIKHYKPFPKTQVPVMEEVVSISNGKKGYNFGSASSLQQICCSHTRDRDQISIGEEEVSDQNFVNEVTKGENGSCKKMKTVMSGSSSTDQVVPLRKSPGT